MLYLDGNSLGPRAHRVDAAVTDLLARQWGRDLIGSWNSNGWWQLPGLVGDRIGRLIGAAPGQVICGDSTSVQLFQAMTAAARLRPDRHVLLTEAATFPTDRYLADSVARLLGLQVLAVPPAGFADVLAGDRGADVALVCCSLVDYRTGELADAADLTARAAAAGAVTVWDLSHAAGALPVELDAVGADFAVGCGYKYLNGGPGAPAFLYVAARHLDRLDLPLTGWHGHADPFALEAAYRPAASVEQARIGTPPVLSMAALAAALTVFDDVDLDAVRAKSLALTDRIIAAADALGSYGVEVVTPRGHGRRGSHVALRMPHAYEVCQALIARGVIADFRAPDLVRLGVTPLYLRHADVEDAMALLAGVLADGAYRDPEFARRGVVT